MIAIYLHLAPELADAKTLEKDLQTWAKSQKDQIAWYRDHTDDGAYRQNFNLMLAEVRKRRFKKVVVWRLDQLGCTGPQFVKLLDEFRKLGVDFMSLQESIDIKNESTED